MNEEINFCLDLAKEQMQESIDHLEISLSKIRAGKASPQMLRSVKVDYYGSITPLSQMANITTPDSQTISIQPFDISCLPLIEKAISISDLGMTPNNDGKTIRINVPPLTEERRKEFCKLASKYAEEGKVALRNIRREAIDKEKKEEKDGSISLDESRDNQQKIQKITDQFIALIDSKLAEKEKEILKV